ncbi:unnamed protein product [Ixodes hexagonus]
MHGKRTTIQGKQNKKKRLSGNVACCPCCFSPVCSNHFSKESVSIPGQRVRALHTHTHCKRPVEALWMSSPPLHFHVIATVIIFMRSIFDVRETFPRLLWPARRPRPVHTMRKHPPRAPPAHGGGGPLPSLLPLQFFFLVNTTQSSDTHKLLVT